jgi:hypothetical protein
MESKQLEKRNEKDIFFGFEKKSFQVIQEQVHKEIYWRNQEKIVHYIIKSRSVTFCRLN